MGSLGLWGYRQEGGFRGGRDGGCGGRPGFPPSAILGTAVSSLVLNAMVCTAQTSPLECKWGPWWGGRHLRCQDPLPKDPVGREGTEGQPVGLQKSSGRGEPGLAGPSASCPWAGLAVSEALPPLSLGNAALGSDRPGFRSWYHLSWGRRPYLPWRQFPHRKRGDHGNWFKRLVVKVKRECWPVRAEHVAGSQGWFPSLMSCHVPGF